MKSKVQMMLFIIENLNHSKLENSTGTSLGNSTTTRLNNSMETQLKKTRISMNFIKKWTLL